MSEPEIPLFPLNTVLFPGGPLPLRIFEPRYLDMVSRCLKGGHGFGVVLIHEGREAGGPARTAQIGTMARIVDWDQGEDGLLGVTAHGQGRFRLQDARVQEDGLNMARVEFLAPETKLPIALRHARLARLLETVLSDLGPLYDAIDKDYEDASWVGYRLAELLPIAMPDKQALLELEDAEARLDALLPVVASLQRDG
ncbi:MAG: LON peptidase substrate-binding domain-containing protein [Gammaproteobacteria bacterium]|nr:LON peptidase substrate-binding domain-containing protein [Gammaproteobacteria bacterium]TVQ46481.1 MAG: peptidase S16 [Gammaproteobacteria bacterium]